MWRQWFNSDPFANDVMFDNITSNALEFRSLVSFKLLDVMFYQTCRSYIFS